MKTGWTTMPLSEACLFSSGLWKGERPPFVRIGVIRNTNFTKTGELDYSDIARLDVEQKKFASRRLQYGDIILEKSGGGPKQPVGRVALFDKRDGDYSFSNFTSAIRVRSPSELDCRFLHKFLYWIYLSGLTEGMQSHSTGIRNLDADAYKAIRIAFPTIVEQQRIVSILDEAFGAVGTAKASAEQNLRNARELFESHLRSIFAKRWSNWVKSTIGEEVKFIDYRGKTPIKTQSGVRLITAKNVKMGYLQEAPLEFIAAASYEGWMTRGIPKKGDVIFTTEAPLANVAQLDTDDPVAFAQRIIVMQPNETILDRTFLKYLLLSPPVQKDIRSRGTGATVQGIKASLLKQIDIAFPASLETQRQVVSRLDALQNEIKRLIRLYEQKLAALDALKKAILHQAFSGEL